MSAQELLPNNPWLNRLFPPLSDAVPDVERLKAMRRYTPTSTTLFGFPLELVDADSFLDMYKEIFVRRNYLFQAKRPNPLIIDCGANIGLSILVFKQQYPDCRIIAFEADPNVFKALETNVSTFGFQNVELHPVAVWNAETTLTFHAEGSWGGRLQKPGDTRSLIEVPAVSLKPFLNQPIDLLKIDIEGAETAVLKDCADALHWVDCLFMEYHGFTAEPQGLPELLTLLSDAGFRYYIKEASTRLMPLVERVNTPMDMQLDIFAFRL